MQSSTSFCTHPDRNSVNTCWGQSGFVQKKPKKTAQALEAQYNLSVKLNNLKTANALELSGCGNILLLVCLHVLSTTNTSILKRTRQAMYVQHNNVSCSRNVYTVCSGSRCALRLR